MTPPATPFRYVLPETTARTDPSSYVDRRRRALLAGLAAGSVLLAHPRILRAGSDGAALAAEPWRTLGAAQARLFPSEPEAPGAIEVRALAYLHQALTAPDALAGERDFLHAGAAWLRAEAARHGAHIEYAALSEDRRDALLTALAGSSDGENWIALMLHYVIEAALADPIYGGNPDGIGWRWLHHVPGFPRPPAAARYPRLLER